MSPDWSEQPAPVGRASLTRTLHEGARTLVFRLPRWNRLTTGPGFIAMLIVLQLALNIGITRLSIDGDAVFHWRSMLAGWATFMLTVWACYVMRPTPPRTGDTVGAPGAAQLLTLVVAQSLCLTVPYMLLYIVATRAGWTALTGAWLAWTLWLAPVAWKLAAMFTLLWRTGERTAGRGLAALLAIVLGSTLSLYLNPAPGFWTEATAQDEQDAKVPVFSQLSVEAQAPLLAAQLAALKPQRPGVADMYTLTFAPYDGEEVFRRESRMVSEVMAKRFDAAGRGLQLLNHVDEVDRAPWATPVNLQRAIAGIARTMDVDEDVLFLHLTSHGAEDGELAVNFWPLQVQAVTPPDLRRWLDEAGIRHRIISVSACYAGNWIAPLASETTLVMTASDADHTSYGCGRKSALTFFGRAMFDEQLRSKTRSFEQAHAAARLVIDNREKEAGKDDGYSNPQIKVGANIRPYLEKMQERLQK